MLPYFAYGSNLDPTQMRQRCPSSQFLCRASLQDYTFGFTRWSAYRQGGVIDIVVKPGAIVWGVLYHLAPEDLPKLDQAEGYELGRSQNAYQPISVQVWPENFPETAIAAFAYEVVDKKPGPILPADHYRQTVLAAAWFWRFPESYLQQLAAVASASGAIDHPWNPSTLHWEAAEPDFRTG